MEQIISRENPRIKRILRLLSDKSVREESDLFVIEGVRLCTDALLSGIIFREIYLTEKALKKYPKLSDIIKKSREAYIISDAIALKISDTKTPQGVFAVCEKRVLERPKMHLPQARYLLLSSLQDPGNVGAIIRTAEAFGIDGVCMSADCPELYAPKTLRATMGGAFRLPVWIVRDMLSEVEQLKSEGVSVFAAAFCAGAKMLDAMSFTGASAVLLGNEGAGLPDVLTSACDFSLTIPMVGRADSLGVAIAAGIIAWEMKNKYTVYE